MDRIGICLWLSFCGKGGVLEVGWRGKLTRGGIRTDGWDGWMETGGFWEGGYWRKLIKGHDCMEFLKGCFLNDIKLLK